MLKRLSPAAVSRICSLQPLANVLTKRLLVTLVPGQPRVSSVFAQYLRFSSTMNSKHLTAGSEFPPLQEGKLRIYNMRFCPYGERALLVAEAKGIAHDIVNVNLNKALKPEWLLERNPGGKVPTIDTPKGPLYESLIVADYIDEVYPGRALNSADPFQRAWDRVLIENFSSVANLHRKVLIGRNNIELVKGLLVELTQALVPFENELKKRGTLFFGGNDHPGMLDYMIWPWIERFPLLKVHFPTLYDFEAAKRQNPLLEKWRQAMKADKAVEAVILSTDLHDKFYRGFLEGLDSPGYAIDYDSYDFTAK